MGGVNAVEREDIAHEGYFKPLGAHLLSSLGDGVCVRVCVCSCVRECVCVSVHV